MSEVHEAEPGRYIDAIEQAIRQAIAETDLILRAAYGLGTKAQQERLKHLRAELERVRALAEDEHKRR